MNVLSVQSHVVHGIVGNKAAVLPLTLRGFSVDPLNVCQLSNHTGHGSYTGQRLQGTELAALIDGLRQIGALKCYDILLTGYVGREDALREVLSLALELKQSRETLRYVFDPVLGDNGSLYVPDTLVPIYRDLVVFADAVTPNGFEASVLTGIEPQTLADAAACCDWFHQRGPSLVVVSSLTGDSCDAAHVVAFASLRVSTSEFIRASVRVPKVKGSFSGTGDLLTALVVSDLKNILDSGKLEPYFGSWCAVIHHVLEMSAELPDDGRPTARFTELRLLNCLDELRHGMRPMPIDYYDGVSR